MNVGGRAEASAGPIAEDDAVVEVRHLKVHLPLTQGLIWRRTSGWVRAVDDVSLVIRRGETLGLVGESGCGKTTVGRTIVQLYRPTAGQVLFDGQDLSALGAEALRRARRHFQMVFQDLSDGKTSRGSLSRSVILRACSN